MRTALCAIFIFLYFEMPAACFLLSIVAERISPAMPVFNRAYPLKKEANEIISKIKDATERRSHLLKKCQRCIPWGQYLTAAGVAVMVLAIVSRLPTLWYAVAGVMAGSGRVLTTIGKSKGSTVKEQMKEDNKRLHELTQRGREMSSRLRDAAETFNQLNRIQKKKMIATSAFVAGGVLPLIWERWPSKLIGLAMALSAQPKAGGAIKLYGSLDGMNLPEFDISKLQKDWDAFVKEVVWESQTLGGTPEMHTSQLRDYSHHYFEELQAVLKRIGYLLTEETTSMEKPFCQKLTTLSLNVFHMLELIANLITGNLSDASKGLQDFADSADDIVKELIRANDLFDICLTKYNCT